MREKRHSPFFKRRQWDSNPRALADNRISSAARYDHFDISPNSFYYISHSLAGQVEILLFCPAAARTMLSAATAGPLYSIPWGLSIMRYQYPKYRECPLTPPVSLK